MTEDKFELQSAISDYLKILYRGRFLIIASFVIVTAITLYNTMQKVPVYEAGAKVMIKDAGSVGAALFEVGSFIKKEMTINNQVEILKSRTLAETVVQRLMASDRAHDLLLLGNARPAKKNGGSFGQSVLGSLSAAESTSTANRTVDVEGAASRLRGSLTIVPIRGTDMIEIRVRSVDPEEAAYLANALTDAYAETNRKMSQQEIRQVKNFLDEQLRIVQEQLEKSENALRDFKERERVVALSSETSALISKLAEFESMHNEALTSLSSLRERLDYIDRQLGKNRENFDIESISTAPYLAELKRQLVDLETQRATWLARLINEGIDYRDHPNLKRYDEQIAVLTRKFKDKVTQLASKEFFDPMAMNEQLWQRKIEVEVEIEALKPKAESLKRIVDEYAGELRGLPEKTLQLAKLERSTKVDEKLFLMMKEKLQESRITEVGQLGDVRIIDPAIPPKSPIGPNRRLDIILGMLLGLGIGVALTFVVNAMDNTIRTVEDAEKIGLTSLGLIPTIKEKEAEIKALQTRFHLNGSTNGTLEAVQAKQMASRLVTHFAPKSPVSEAYRTFRTNIQYSRLDSNLKTLLVTSPGPGEGKSTTVANLAITMAQMGSRVLLVDADLRRPVLHSIFGVDRHNGLTNVLVGRSLVEEVVQSTEIENLSLMPCGTLPPNPSELLGSNAMRQLIADLKERYDMVLFDSPPVIAVTDAAVLGSRLDGLILVLKSAQTDRHAAFRAQELLKGVKTPVLGALLNGVRMESLYGSYYYYYHYYYYGRDGDKKRRKSKQR